MSVTSGSKQTKSENFAVLRRLWRIIPLEWRRPVRRRVLRFMKAKGVLKPTQPSLNSTGGVVGPSTAPDGVLAEHSASKPAAGLPASEKLQVSLPLVSSPIPPSTLGPDLGLLSVVVPVYNVETYLDECLSSIVNQTYPNLEILVVDDGSTDGSLEIANRFAAEDYRIKIIEQTNAGLGAARNTGTAEAMGDFITFADSDDVVPEYAYEKMLSTLDASGSDFVVGSLHRLKGGVRSVPNWAQEVHAIDRIAVTLEENTDILQDVFAWNKVFRRTFWDKHVRSFPEGVLYEDQETTARAYAYSKSFDIIHDVVYDWRIRQDRTSITQQKDNIVDVTDRLTVAMRLADFMTSETSPEVASTWLAKVLGPDLGLYYAQVPRVDDDYWETLMIGVTQLAQKADDTVWAKMSVHHRILVSLLVADERGDFEQIILFNAERGSSYPIEQDSGRLLARPGYLGLLESEVDESLLVVAEEQLEAKAVLKAIEWEEQGLALRGYAYVEGVAGSVTAPTLKVQVVNAVSGQRVMVPYQRLSDSSIDREVHDAWCSYADTAFEAVVEPSVLNELLASVRDDCEWHFELSVMVGDASITTMFTKQDQTGSAGEFPIIPVVDSSRLVCSFDGLRGLSLHKASYGRFVDDIEISGRTLTLSPKVRDSESAVGVLLECPSLKLKAVGKPVESDGNGDAFTVVLPALPSTAGKTTQHIWKVRVQTADGKFHHVAWRHSSMDLEKVSPTSEPLRARASVHGFLELHERRWQVAALECEFSPAGDALVLRGYAAYSDIDSSRLVLPKLVLANEGHQIWPSKTYWTANVGEFVAEFPLGYERWGRIQAAPEPGTYTLRCITAGNGGLKGAYWVPVTSALSAGFPREHTTPYSNVRISRTPKAGALAVNFSAPLGTDERGKLMQQRLQREIPSLIKSNVEEGTVLFETFAGKSIGDSGLGLFNEMVRRGDSRDKYWVVRSRTTPVPQGSKPVLIYSAEWYRLLHTAEFVVNNNNFPYYYRKNPGQKYVQTWHGTPLKKIANDVVSSQLSLSYMKLMEREAGYWDYLLAQNEFAEEVLPNEFGYGGSTLTLGYPRNDSLVGDAALLRREVVRQALGIPTDQKVVLYAPTWRDNVRNASGKYDLVTHLEVDKASQALGSSYTFLLRGHHNVSDQRYAAGQARAIDVTAYPDVNDLFLAADILVTDYSSVMFDYCVTGKPIYFLTPDLEQYRDQVRGFYFDFESSSPGPLTRSTEELVDAMARDASGSMFIARYEEFRSRFAGLDDGHASSRVYDVIWGEHA
ncbi:bifunctional glycosyltransferase/CDP-glycerol:glycerophosphate glycerophosphotransferase [Paenarthrobacter ureafaciens]|uniref:bifunctional glycosyltransferase/CDP-glycerol:glycerophosphate glycerophosphotransferase n=1 Tax=Paenarthrobacter ureafaciens TaxID=37931 RepID=UPI0022703359|nr:bifunctional glycosyltransferase family 2 protein/CDP-glycerol:glycerophosphate glycerophosphotransferase [Paenarthrobacter ureafaciens]MCY0972638.1 bifunctional glycosyltransferase family 2 protein/CDP-glycerol:glycerophosphate glycerophosphotransferase [Paenarthrobacter ureafaciens]